jgi:hypothetical protein
MRKFIVPSTAILGAMLVLSLHAAPAQAQVTRAWVSGDGADSGSCPRTTPCATFQFAHDATMAGGEIVCVDAGNYGAVNITKSISIICDNTRASILDIAAPVKITINAGMNDIITLKGLDIEGASSGGIGIKFNSGAALHVHKLHIRNFRSNSGLVGGIFFAPNAYAELYVADSYITDNGTAGNNGGIVIQPTATGAANVSVNRVRLENNSTGISVDGTQTTGVAVNVTILDSLVAGSAGNGISAVTTAGHAAVSVFFDHSVASGNFGSGLKADGGAASGMGSATVRIGGSTIVLNVTGVSTAGLGVAQSFKDNRISGNGTDGTPIAAFPGPGGSALQ